MRRLVFIVDVTGLRLPIAAERNPKTLQKRGQAQIERKTQQPESQISTITSVIAHTHQKDRKMLLCDAHNGRVFYFSSRERRLFRGRTDKKGQVEIRLERGGRR